MPEKRIGLIAGSGQFPILFARSAARQGYKIFAAAYASEADPALAEHVDVLEWMYLGQIRRLIRFFQHHHVQEAVMVGAIQKTRMFSDIRPDMRAVMLIATLRSTHDDAVLRGFAGLLEKKGIQIRPSTFLMPDLLAPPGCWTKRKPTRSEKEDIELGLTIAREIGKLDIGQCVVMGGGSVLAVEAIDGTDATILRGGRLGNGNAVAVKICKPNQDTRFDIPAIGRTTVEIMNQAGVRCLAVEAGKSVVFDRSEMVEKADTFGISIIGI
jgi:hypothetical protein